MVNRNEIRYNIGIDNVTCELLLRPEMLIKQPPMTHDITFIKLHVINAEHLVEGIEMHQKVKIDDATYVKILDEAIDKIIKLRDEVKTEILIKEIAKI
jgi:hypothetical protein